MEQSSVLSLDSVDRIRFYVQQKYAHLPQEKHAEIVADAIVKVIERQLPPYHPELKRHITNTLIEQVVIPQKRPVSLQDIDMVCSEAPLTNGERELLQNWRVDKGVIVETITTQWSLWSSLTTSVNEHRKSVTYGLASLMLIFAVSLYAYFSPSVTKDKPADLVAINESSIAGPIEVLAYNELPSDFQYIAVNESLLIQYLNSRNSILVDEPYYTAIMDTAKQFNIHPVLLFAITGQEQAFVSRDNERAAEIANNPFNVFHSWEDYNTTIDDSTAIAARTLVNLSKDRPQDIDPIVWINRKYAEDPNWSTGVNSLFTTMINYIND
ncbi:MAG TPA: glucosaminidase domain-containing protein [Candidatus Paenibacillus intestinavium]|nr:glucosaminidase domain-containing protein [Candidatus Paenibacillus intestinavium]